VTDYLTNKNKNKMINKFRQPIFREDKKFSGKFHYFTAGEKCAGYLNHFLQSDEELFIFQQNTGIKDRNGLDIYIGTILKILEKDCKSDTHIGFYQVFYDLNNHCLKLECLHSDIIKTGCNIYFHDSYFIEVIGNNFDFDLTKYVKIEELTLSVT